MADYIIQKGDTLTKIAAQYNTSVEELTRQNNITNPGLIFEGSTLKVPGEEAADRNQIPDNQESLEEEMERMQAQIDEMKSYTPEENNELTPWEIVGLGAGGAVSYNAVKHAAPHIAKGATSAAKSVAKGTKATGTAVANGAKTGAKAISKGTRNIGSWISKTFKHLTKGAELRYAFAKDAVVKGTKSAGKAVKYGAKHVAKGAELHYAFAKDSTIKGIKSARNTVVKGAKVARNAVNTKAIQGAKILKVGKAGKLLGRAAAPVAAAVSAVEVYDAYKTGGTKAAVKQGAKCASGLACAAAGAKIGALVGACTGPAAPVAVPVLTVVGSIAGYFGGEKLVDGICKLFKKA